jgi:DNA replication protein DnaC
MSTNNVTDTARLSLLLNELRLPAIKLLWPQFAEQADKEGWPAARFLVAIAEHELAERDRRRIERHLAEARLLPGKTLDTFAFEAVPMISRAQITAIAAGDAWLEKGANLLLFGPPGGEKSHLASAIGLAMAGRFSSPGRSIWCKSSRSRAANSTSKPQSTGSTASTC